MGKYKRISQIILMFFLVVFIFSPKQLLGDDTEEMHWEEREILNSEPVSFSHPILLDINNDSLIDVITGRDQGTLIVQLNIGSNSDVSLQNHESGYFEEIYTRSAPSFLDFDGDGLIDILIGDYSGSLHLLLRNSSNPDKYYFNSSLIEGVAVASYAKPTSFNIDGDGDFDLIVGNGDGKLIAFINNGTLDHPIWIKNEHIFEQYLFGGHAAPFAIDPDHDGNYDLVVGTEGIGINYLKNMGRSDKDDFPSWNSIPFSNEGNPFHSIPGLGVMKFVTPHLIDMNNDDFLDLCFGNANGSINIYLNQGVDLSVVSKIISSGISTQFLIYFSLILIFVVASITFVIVRNRSIVKGAPLFLMVLHSS
ncbi:MAG: FG-GAP repeat domain-containing protein, partial [Candidatus Kariarchaeaceae archaeon]